MVIGAAASFKGFGASFNAYPRLRGMNAAEKHRLVSGPLFDVCMAAAEAIPPGDKDTRVFFIDIMDIIGKSRGAYYTSKVRYYLAPRNVVVVSQGGEWLKRDVREGDYLLLVVPPDAAAGFAFEEFERFFTVKTLYARSEQGGFLALYRVVRMVS